MSATLTQNNQSSTKPTNIDHSIKSSASNLKRGLTESQTDGAVIQMYLTSVQMQPDIVQDVVPSLPQTQQHAREVAQTWTDNVLPKMTQTVTDLISFANQWNSYKNTMLNYAQQIASTTNTQNEKDAARYNLDMMLGQVYNSVEQKENSAIQAKTQIQNFQAALSESSKNFDSALKQLQQAYAGKDGILSQLDAQIDQLHTAIARDATLITLSCITTIGGGLMIAAGSIGEFITAGTSTELVLAGIATTAAGITGIAGSSADLNAKVKELGHVTSLKSQDEQMYAVVKTAISSVSLLSTKCSDAVISADNLSNMWSGLKSELDALRNDVRLINPGDFAVAHAIQYADSDWISCLNLAQTIQANTAGGNIPVQRGVDGKYPLPNTDK
jgi:hypothetical protein